MKNCAFILFVICVFKSVVSEKCGVRKTLVATLYNGDEAEKGEFPWMVAFIHKSKGNFFCAGSLISAQHVLSGEIMNFCNQIHW